MQHSFKVRDKSDVYVVYMLIGGRACVCTPYP
nr:MAG TPA: hypothetical protein [Caudoviricetes sp.]